MSLQRQNAHAVAKVMAVKSGEADARAAVRAVAATTEAHRQRLAVRRSNGGEIGGEEEREACVSLLWAERERRRMRRAGLFVRGWSGMDLVAARVTEAANHDVNVLLSYLPQGEESIASSRGDQAVAPRQLMDCACAFISAQSFEEQDSCRRAPIHVENSSLCCLP